MRWTVRVLVVCALLVTIMVVVGWRLPPDHHAQASALIDAPPLAVWTIISDVQSAPQWRPEVKRVEMLAGNRWRESGAHGTMTFRLGDAEPMRKRIVVFDDAHAPFAGQWTFTLQPTAQGETVVTIREDATVLNPVWRFVGHYIIGERSSIDHYLRDLHNTFAYKK